MCIHLIFFLFPRNIRPKTFLWDEVITTTKSIKMYFQILMYIIIKSNILFEIYVLMR